MTHDKKSLLGKTVRSLAVCCSVALATATMAPAADTKLSSDDKDFIEEAAQGGTAEVELARLALKKSTREDIKKFANELIKDHTAANAELGKIAGSKGEKLPSGAGVKNAAMKARLTVLAGNDFNQAYVNRMVDDHQSDVAAFQKEAGNSSADADIKNYAAKTLPVLQKHLEHIKKIQGELLTTGRK
jgi:putative membrane protein